MSPRLTSPMTTSPAVAAYSQTSSNARTPSAPRASKNALCGLTATQYGQAAAEARVRVRGRLAAGVGVAAQLKGQQVELRVETEDELAPLLDDGGGKPVGEGPRRH